MKKMFLVALAFCLSLAIWQCSPADQQPAAELSPEQQKQAAIERGEYLVGIAGCNDCHTPKIMTEMGPAPDMKMMLAGHPASEQLPAITDSSMIAPGQWALFNSSLTAAVGPWGISFAANITPDDTGIGNWTYEQFEKALREGKSKGMDGTRPLLPPMPWFNYIKMSDEDMRAIFAYLQSIPPVNNAVPNPIPPAGS